MTFSLGFFNILILSSLAGTAISFVLLSALFWSDLTKGKVW